MSRSSVFWLTWLLLTLIAVLIVVTLMSVGGDRQLLLVGNTTDAHHQIEMACETCHAAGIFASTKTAAKAMNKTCQNCHNDELARADDSHPIKKFRSPRMAEYWEKLDARLCTSCHIEHRPELTRKGAVTVAMNFCIACHSEGDQDVRQNRTSHAELTFETCASAGCHNYHDNRSLYADFLVKHAQGKWLAVEPIHQLTALYLGRDKTGDKQLTQVDALVPTDSLNESAAVEEWASSAHASAAINCHSCHAQRIANDSVRTQLEAYWTDNPNLGICNDCHKIEANTFRHGRHGMRQHPKLANPRNIDSQLQNLGLSQIMPAFLKSWISDPIHPTHMTVAEARLPMRQEAVDKILNCATCHDPHTVNVRYAAVEACLGCHNDGHSLAYMDSMHYEIWRSESSGDAEPGTGVSCATCHMAKIKRRSKVVSNHNQNDTLRPNEKMIRPVCLNCHGLGFALNSLADEELIARNFNGQPSAQVQSISWALDREMENEKTQQ